MQSEDPWAVRQEIARKIGETYPTWEVWITEHTWWATRRTPLPVGTLRYRLYATVVADSPRALRAEIDEQDARQRAYEQRLTTAQRRHLRP